MKKNARILSLLLSVAMVFGLMIVPAAAEESTPVVTVAKYAVDTEDASVVTYDVAIAGNTGFDTMEWEINYSEGLELLSIVTFGDDEIDFMAPLTVEANSATAKITAAGSRAFTKNGTLFQLVFKFAEGTTEDVVSINITNNFVKVSNVDVPMTFVGIEADENGNGETPNQPVDPSNPEDGNTNPPTGLPTGTPEGGDKDDSTDGDTDAPVICATEVSNAVIPADEVPADLKEAAGENAEFYNVVLNVTECKAGLEEEPADKPTSGTPNQGETDSDVEGDTNPTTPNPTPNQPTPNTPVEDGTDTDVDGKTTPNPTPNQPTTTPNGSGSDSEAGDTDVDHTNCVTRPATEDEVAAYIEENGGIEVSIDLPEGVSEETHTIKVLALVDGEVVEIEAAIADGKITFTLDGLYPVAICWTEIVVEEEVEEECQMIMPRLLPVTVEVEEGAKVNTSAKFAIAYGARRTIKITVEEGYEVADIIVNGKSVGAAETYTLKGVTKAQNIVIKTVAVAEEVAE